MILFRNLGFFLVFLLSSCAHSSSKKEKTGVNFSEEAINVDAIVARLEPVLSQQIGGAANVGAVVGIYHGGRIKYLSLGEVKKGNGIKPDENTLFEVGSLTKPITGLLFSIALEEGRVKETTTLGELKKEWKGQKAGEITLLELANHQSGLPRLPCNLKIKDEANPYADYDEKDLVQGLKDSSFHEGCELSRASTPGRFYSNWGFSLLGYALSLKQKTTYPVLLQQKITKPLELFHTDVVLTSVQKKSIAQGYDEKLNEAPLWDRKILFGQGAVISNATDMMNFVQAYLHGDVTPIAKAITRSKGFAWNQTKTGSLWHNGQTGGFASFMKIYPAHDLAVFYLTNTSREFRCFLPAVESTDCKLN